MAKTSEPTNERLDRLESLLSDVGELTVTHSEIIDGHNIVLQRIEEQTAQNSVAIANLTSRVDALTTTTTETLRLVADNSIEIRRIWEYLLGQSGNGRQRQ